MTVLLQQPFYRHDTLGPGAPLTLIDGQGEGDGFYDWAGRRLFLADGEPDPMCPGAYRYQHNRASCDLDAPDSDPRSPRYEPAHLRHQPGDTWIIDTRRPYDPHDPGPYGSPGWYADERTGRHRRDELPDPLPAEDWEAPEDAWYPGIEERCQAPTAHGQRQPAPRTGDGSWMSGACLDEPAAPTEARNRDDSEAPEDRDRGSGAGHDWPRWRPRVATGDSDRGSADSHGRPRWRPSGHDEGPTRRPQRGEDDPRFSAMREAAMDRFIRYSAELHAAHFEPEQTYLRERLAWAARWLLWVLALGLAPMPRPLTTSPSPTAPRPELPAPRISSETVTARAPVPAPASGPGPDAVPDRPRPGSQLAAAIGGARAARRTIADRRHRTSTDLADRVRASANTAPPARTIAAAHWRTRPRQGRPRPTPVPYMTAWERAFDTATLLYRPGTAA